MMRRRGELAFNVDCVEFMHIPTDLRKVVVFWWVYRVPSMLCYQMSSIIKDWACLIQRG